MKKVTLANLDEVYKYFPEEKPKVMDNYTPTQGDWFAVDGINRLKDRIMFCRFDSPSPPDNCTGPTLSNFNDIDKFSYSASGCCYRSNARKARPIKSEEKQWLEACIKAGTFVPKEQIMETKEDFTGRYCKATTDNANSISSIKKGDVVKLVKRLKDHDGIYEVSVPKGDSGYVIATGNFGICWELMPVDYTPESKRSAILDTYGLKVGDKLPEKVLNAYGESANYIMDDSCWQVLRSFSGDREIESFEIKSSEVVFKISGTSTVWGRAKGFKEFMDNFNKPKLEKGKYYSYETSDGIRYFQFLEMDKNNSNTNTTYYRWAKKNGETNNFYEKGTPLSIQKDVIFKEVSESEAKGTTLSFKTTELSSLPDKWWITINGNKEIQDYYNRQTNSKCYFAYDSGYFPSHDMSGKSVLLGGCASNFHCSQKPKNSGVEITFEQFKKWVLKEENKTIETPKYVKLLEYGKEHFRSYSVTVGKIYKFPDWTDNNGSSLSLNKDFSEWKGIFIPSTESEYLAQNKPIVMEEREVGYKYGDWVLLEGGGNGLAPNEKKIVQLCKIDEGLRPTGHTSGDFMWKTEYSGWLRTKKENIVRRATLDEIPNPDIKEKVWESYTDHIGRKYVAGYDPIDEECRVGDWVTILPGCDNGHSRIVGNTYKIHSVDERGVRVDNDKREKDGNGFILKGYYTKYYGNPLRKGESLQKESVIMVDAEVYNVKVQKSASVTLKNTENEVKINVKSKQSIKLN